MKALFIVIYLFSKIGWLTVIGLGLSGAIVQSTLYLTSKIEGAIFRNVAVKQEKVNILTKYLTRIVDYQMSWLDSFVGKIISSKEKQYQ